MLLPHVSFLMKPQVFTVLHCLQWPFVLFILTVSQILWALLHLYLSTFAHLVPLLESFPPGTCIAGPHLIHTSAPVSSSCLWSISLQKPKLMGHRRWLAHRGCSVT